MVQSEFFEEVAIEKPIPKRHSHVWRLHGLKRVCRDRFGGKLIEKSHSHEWRLNRQTSFG